MRVPVAYEQGMGAIGWVLYYVQRVLKVLQALTFAGVLRVLGVLKVCRAPLAQVVKVHFKRYG